MKYKILVFLLLIASLSVSVFATDSEWDEIPIDFFDNDIEPDDALPDETEPDEIIVIEKLDVDEFLNNDFSEFLLETFSELNTSTASSSSIGFEADTVLGHLQFVLPAGSVADPFLELEGGNLINISNSTLYLFCPAYPSYTFQASRFSEFQYRTATNSSWRSLELSNISGLSAAAPGTSVMEYLPVIFLAIIAFYCFASFTRSFGRF